MMNSNPQFDLHPDAESLNAFAEQALGERERAQIVAHLAECGRCRDVVFLAQEAVAQMEVGELVVAMPAVAASQVVRKAPWYRNWRLAWVPGALAAIVTVAYVVHERRVELAAEQAKLAAEASARPVEIARALPKPTMEMQAVPPRVAGIHALAAKNAKPEAPGARPMTLGIAAGPLTGGANEMVSAKRAPAPAPTAPPAVGAAPLRTGETADSKKEPELADGRERQGQAMDAQRNEARAATMQAMPKAETSASEQVSAMAPAGFGAASSAEAKEGTLSSGNGLTSGRYKSSGVAALYKSKQAGLPSGLVEVSRAALNARCVVAIDGVGGVFLTEDAGNHWTTVARQWTGRAVAVHVEKATGSDQGAAPSPGAFFEMANEQGQEWVSTDGRNWMAK